MQNVSRNNPMFSLCGLNCCLCPRFNTDSVSKCPGCGGVKFIEKHPTCAVMTCNTKHGKVEYCFLCSDYPCKKYCEDNHKDSFISYKMVKTNMDNAAVNIESYFDELNRRKRYLDDLLLKFNDGRRKGLYCLAANDLPINTLDQVFDEIKNRNIINIKEIKERSKKVVEIINTKASSLNIELVLRK